MPVIPIATRRRCSPNGGELAVRLAVMVSDLQRPAVSLFELAMVSQSGFALITGGSRGIGLAVAHLLRQRGNNVAILSRSHQHISDALHHIESSYGDGDGDGNVMAVGKCMGVSCDVSDNEQRKRAFDEVVSKFGYPT